MKERKAYVLPQQVILIIQIIYYAKTVVPTVLCYSNLSTYLKINVSTYILNWNNFEFTGIILNLYLNTILLY